MVKTSSHSYRYAKITSKLGLLFFFITSVGVVISLEFIITFKSTAKPDILKVDGFKGYLDRQFTSGSCALTVYTLSKVYLSVTNGKLTLCILAKHLCFTKTQRREVNK